MSMDTHLEGVQLAETAPAPAAAGGPGAPQPKMMLVQVPQGVAAGQQMVITSPSGGHQLTVIVPQGVAPGDSFQVAQPAPATSEECVLPQPARPAPQPEAAGADADGDDGQHLSVFEDEANQRYSQQAQPAPQPMIMAQPVVATAVGTAAVETDPVRQRIAELEQLQAARIATPAQRHRLPPPEYGSCSSCLMCL